MRFNRDQHVDEFAAHLGGGLPRVHRLGREGARRPYRRDAEMIGPEPDQPFDEAYIGIKGAVEAAPWPL